MARPLRVEYPGAVYHVMGRGNERRRVFHRDSDVALFYETLEEALDRFGVRLQAFCLMPNHYHVVLETPEANLSRAWGWMQTTFTIRYNRDHRRSGHLFQGRFKAQIVDADDYAARLVEYIHLNPVRRKEKGRTVIVGSWEELQRYPWSSHGAYCERKSPVRGLRTEWLHYWDSRGMQAGARAYEKTMRGLVGAGGEPVVWQELQRGWLLGDEVLEGKVKQLLEKKKGQDEAQWQRKQKYHERRPLLQKLLREEKDPRWQMWLRVKLGGERPVDVGEDLGYRSRGAAVLEHLKNLEARAEAEGDVKRKFLRYRELIFES